MCCLLCLQVQDAQQLKPSDLVQFVIQAVDGRSKEKHAVRVKRTKVHALIPLQPEP